MAESERGAASYQCNDLLNVGLRLKSFEFYAILYINSKSAMTEESNVRTRRTESMRHRLKAHSESGGREVPSRASALKRAVGVDGVIYVIK